MTIVVQLDFLYLNSPKPDVLSNRSSIKPTPCPFHRLPVLLVEPLERPHGNSVVRCRPLRMRNERDLLVELVLDVRPRWMR